MPVSSTNRRASVRGLVAATVASAVLFGDPLAPAQVAGRWAAKEAIYKALGIPLNSVPRDITQTENGKSDVRVYLERELNSAVESGDISESDEKAVLVAFERGLVMPASDGIVAESYPAN